jgi:hypothetical protein
MKYLLIAVYWIGVQNSTSAPSVVHEHYESQAACEAAAAAISTINKERIASGGRKIRVNTYCVALSEERAPQE